MARPETRSPAQAETAATNARAGSAEAGVRRALESINSLLDAYFDFNAYRLRPDAVEAVTHAAFVLRGHMASDAALRLIVEGHCDERGSAEFNLALGESRAQSVKEMLVQMGLDDRRVETISYGENRPQCSDGTELCHQRNRRAHIRHER